eukprot:1184773-Prorocentrum_minimum.AAC.2
MDSKRSLSPMYVEPTLVKHTRSAPAASSLPASSHDGPIGRRKCGIVLTTDQPDAESAGLFSRRTNRTQKVRDCSHHGPIGR